MIFTTRLVTAMLLGACLVAGCGESSPPVNDMVTADMAPTSLISEPTLSAIQTQLFNRSCNFSNSCHNAVGNEGGLTLTDLERSCQELVNAPAEAPGAVAQGLLRVVPGDAEASFFYQKLAAPEANLGFYMDDPELELGERMPQRSPPLDPATLATIAEWINSGASCK